MVVLDSPSAVQALPDRRFHGHIAFLTVLCLAAGWAQSGSWRDKLSKNLGRWLNGGKEPAFGTNAEAAALPAPVGTLPKPHPAALNQLPATVHRASAIPAPVVVPAPLATQAPADGFKLESGPTAQGHGFQFEGRVELDGAPCPNATVRVHLMTPSEQQTLEAQTDSGGFYHLQTSLEALPHDPLDWTIEAETEHHRSVPLLGRRIAETEPQAVTVNNTLDLR